MKRHIEEGSYYHLWIAAAHDSLFFQSNLDKACVISIFQNILSPRNQNVRSDSVSLVAYSLTDFGMNLLLYAKKKDVVEGFGQVLLLQYAAYLTEQRSWEVLPFDTIFTNDRLKDEHEALVISKQIHLLHHYWRNDRYSSIGFYLDDRRGDWIQPWRLVALFNNDRSWYEHYLKDELPYEKTSSPELEYIET